MAKIYASAKQVVVWLGENYGDINEAFETLYAIAEKLVPIWKASMEGEDPAVLSLRTMAFKADPNVRRLHWDSLAELLKRAWFQRVRTIVFFSCLEVVTAQLTQAQVWCIQEIVNAKEAVIKWG